MVKIGFSMQNEYDRPTNQVIELLNNAGFSAISPVWSNDIDLNLIANCAHKHNMTIQSLHAPHGIPIKSFWNSKEPFLHQFIKHITDCVDDCVRFNIPTVVMHGWSGFDYIFPSAPLDFSIFDRIVDYAHSKGISIAFENLEGEEYLEALLNHYEDRINVGYCWDSGHDHCYPHKLDFLEQFGNRLIMTHIHDNLGLRDPLGNPSGNDDLHFLPFDGNIKWENVIKRLRDLPKQNILNFEFKKRSASSSVNDLIYDEFSTEEFINLAGRRARKIAELYDKVIKEKTSPQ